MVSVIELENDCLAIGFIGTITITLHKYSRKSYYTNAIIGDRLMAPYIRKKRHLYHEFIDKDGVFCVCKKI